MALASDACAFAPVNRGDTGTFPNIGSEVGQLPATNLLTTRLSRVWRTATLTAPATTGRTLTAATWFELDLGATYQTQLVALIGHNLLGSAQWRVRLATVSNFSSTVYDSGVVDIWPSIPGYGGLSWGVFQWGDELSAAERLDHTGMGCVVLDAAVTARYLRIDLFDAANPDGHLQAGRLWVGPIWQPSINMELDWKIGFEDPSEITRGMGGEITVDERPRYRVVTLTIGHLPEDEMMFNVMEYLDRRKGTSGDFVFVPRPNSPEYFLFEAIYCRQRALNPIANPYVDSRRSRAFELEELI